MAEYDIGDLVRESAEFKNSAGVAADPTVVSVTYTKPNGVTTTKTYPTDTELKRESVGNYYIEFTPAAGEHGTWTGYFAGTGAIVAQEPFIFVVRPRYALNALDILTLDEAKRAVNVTDVASTLNDVELAAYITAASVRIDELVGPVVKRTITNEAHDGAGAFIWPRQTPILSVTSVIEYENGTATTLTAETVTVSATADFLIEGTGHNTVIRRRGAWVDARFPAGRANVLVTYVAGRYNTTADVHPKFKTAAGIMLANLWRREQNSAANVTFSIGDQLAVAGREKPSPTYAVPNAVLELLAEEMRPPVMA